MATGVATATESAASGPHNTESKRGTRSSRAASSTPDPGDAAARAGNEEHTGVLLKRCGPVYSAAQQSEYMGDELDPQSVAAANRRNVAPRPRSLARIREMQRKKRMLKKVRAVLEVFARRMNVEFNAFTAMPAGRLLASLRARAVREASYRDLRAVGVSDKASKRSLARYEVRAKQRLVAHSRRDVSPRAGSAEPGTAAGPTAASPAVAALTST